MKRVYKRISVVTGFLLLLLLLIANTWVTRRQIAQQVESQTWVTHTQDVLYQLSETASLLKDAETGQRGFLYTGDPKYLAPYNSAVSMVAPAIDELARMTANNPRQQARIPQLRESAQRKLFELAKVIDLYRSGHPAEALAEVRTDKGLHYMEEFRKTSGEMRQEELALAAGRAQAYQQSVRATLTCVWLAAIAAAVGLGLLAWHILQEMDMRERHASALREREEWFRVTLTGVGEAVIATDRQGCVTFLNPVAERLTGRSLAIVKGEPIHKVFPIFNEYTREPVENPVRKVMETGTVVGLANHTVLEHSDGSLLPIEDSAAPIRNDRGELDGVVLVFRDATVERKSQEVLRRTEKLAAAARLSATFAHEINNPLEAVNNLVYLARNTPGVPQSAVDHLALAEQELARVSHITRQTLGFYRESGLEEDVELEPLIENVLTLYSNKFKSKSIHIERDFHHCPPIRGLSGELKQAIANIISNAADAVGSDGSIHVHLDCLDLPDGKAIQVLVQDNGPGVAPEHIERIFEPFYTTKKDVGTGLGLWVTREIISRHGGTIQVRNQSGGSLNATGAVFDILLPLRPSPNGMTGTSAG